MNEYQGNVDVLNLYKLLSHWLIIQIVNLQVLLKYISRLFNAFPKIIWLIKHLFKNAGNFPMNDWLIIRFLLYEKD